ncbi:MAG: Gfo/Idh/MocA family oxidoreductase [Bacteroidetes bacterium]|jgi:predicted dehydrogenase|nr:Gfo/Idh/MocA family oxidoreductase [Bacteroidota bacterium]MDF1868139.1 Gfo/Idh/MocA family oxidoreductase [Saprospiraceae bacterium]
MDKTKLKIGVLGVGHLGKIHIKCLLGLEEFFEVVGFYDPDEHNAQNAIEKFGLKRFESVDELLENVSVVDIVTPTTTHFELAANAIQKGKHLFIEKPLTHTIQEAEKLLILAQNHPVKIQIGHVERFNPAFLALKDSVINPMFIEAHRLAAFNPRGTDVSVILDLMIHDLDIVLKVVNSEIKNISASGVAVVSDSPDIGNVRLEFENGCVANLTASRISLKQMRKIRLFQKDAYISLDFLEKEAQIVKMYDKGASNVPENANFLELETQNGTKLITMEMPESEAVNAIQLELKTLAQSIWNNEKTPVPIEEGYQALKLAHLIIGQIEERLKMVTGH